MAITQQMQTANPDGKLKLCQQGDYIVAYCPALELSSYGHTETEAKKSFQEVLEIFLAYCDENNTLEQNLKTLGITNTQFEQIIKEL